MSIGLLAHPVPELTRQLGQSVGFVGSIMDAPEIPEAGRFFIDELEFGFQGSCEEWRRARLQKGTPFRLGDGWISKLSPENIPCLAEPPEGISITEEERASLLLSRKGELAVVERQGVRLRSKSGLEGNVVSVLPLGEPVTLMESTLTTDTINNQRDLWYRVRTIRGIVGWVFGGHLRICGRRIW